MSRDPQEIPLRIEGDRGDGGDGDADGGQGLRLRGQHRRLEPQLRRHAHGHLQHHQLARSESNQLGRVAWQLNVQAPLLWLCLQAIRVLNIRFEAWNELLLQDFQLPDKRSLIVFK